MVKNKVKCVSIDTRDGFKTAEETINNALKELGDTVIVKSIETVHTQSGKSNVIIHYIQKSKFKE